MQSLAGLYLTVGFLLLFLSPLQCSGKRPNILMILADDLGYNDVSWHNPDMPTDHLHRLAREGVILEQAYSQQVCTPSRAALLTGKYPFHIGRQKRALKPLQPTGLTLNTTTLPQEMKKLGYQTHMVGKWHLGYCNVDYTPTKRGFDSFLGFYLGSQNYFNHDRDYKSSPSDPPTFYDFRNNLEVAIDGYKEEYSTTIFRNRTIDIIRTVQEQRDLNVYNNYDPFFIYLSFQATHAPLQARASALSRIAETRNPARDIYKAMVLDMDSAVDQIVKSLKSSGLYDDTIIVFSTDNGGAISHGASNWPLRGTKGTMFEGGTRAVSFVHGPKWLEKNGYTNSKLLHITDWMPTFLGLGGYEGDASRDLGLDGVDQWETISTDNKEAREEMMYNLKVGPTSGAFRMGDYKLLFGKKFNKQGWYNVDTTALQCNRMIKSSKEKAAKKEKRKKNKDRKKEKKRGKGKQQRNSRKLKNKQTRREEKRSRKAAARNEWRKEKKLNKIWKDWLPLPDKARQNLIRLRMDECNWDDFSSSGHDKDGTLNPRSVLNKQLREKRSGGETIVEILHDTLNPFNISASDEDSEFEPESENLPRSLNWSLERQLDDADMALYNIREDPEERRDLKKKLPEIFQKLRSRILFHMEHVVEEDFPPQDFSGHPRYFGGYFSPGWCDTK